MGIFSGPVAPMAQEERTAVCAFLRRFTHLKELEGLIKIGAHRWREDELRQWCEKQGIGLREPE